MHTEAMKQRVNELAKAKSAQDIQAALAIYHPHASLVTTGLNAQAKGAVEIEQQLNVFFTLFPDYHLDILDVACNEKTLLATGYVSVTPTLPNYTGQRVKQLTSFSFEFHENRISKEVFFLDFGLLCKTAGISQQQLSEAMKQIISESKASHL